MSVAAVEAETEVDNFGKERSATDPVVEELEQVE